MFQRDRGRVAIILSIASAGGGVEDGVLPRRSSPGSGANRSGTSTHGTNAICIPFWDYFDGACVVLQKRIPVRGLNRDCNWQWFGLRNFLATNLR